MVSYTTVLYNGCDPPLARRRRTGRGKRPPRRLRRWRHGRPDEKGAATMAEPVGPHGHRPPTPLRVSSGFDVLEKWSEHATQVEKNIVHRVLFAIVDRSVFVAHDVVDDVTKTMEFFVLCRCDLTVKIRLHDFESCGIVYVGPTCTAPGLDQAEPRALEAEPEETSDPGTTRERQDTPHRA
jgi:hypothetical protein